MASPNTLYYGDNLDILRVHVDPESVDLVYLDPPFNSKATYNVLFGERNGTKAAAQIKAFEDTWHWDAAAAAAYQQVVEGGGRISEALQAFHQLLGGGDMLAYLAMMAPRLVALHRALKPTGSLYLHCDPTASHYLKVLLDAVFGVRSFRNEIIWRRYGTHNDAGQGSKHFGRVHDVVLFYTKTDSPTWNQVFTPLDRGYVERTYRHLESETGRRFSTTPMTGPGGAEKGNPVFEWKGHTRAWRYNKDTMERLDREGRIYYSKTGYARQKLYLDESKGIPVQDEWTDIPSLSGAHAERLGYPTQKPEALLERIIQASSNEGDLVLDPFCGCGTTVVVAQRLGRRWIGIDITHLAIGLMKRRLRDTFGNDIPFQVVGEPVSLPDARALAEQDAYQFQWWALGLAGARPAEKKKGADRGIDGRIYFHDEAGGKTKQVILSVKSGHVGVSDLRELSDVVRRENAAIGVLITLRDPTRPMRTEAVAAGSYHSPGWNRDYPRLQILTVEQLLAGQGIDMPPLQQTGDTFKKAPRSRPRGQGQQLQFGDKASE